MTAPRTLPGRRRVLIGAALVVVALVAAVLAFAGPFGGGSASGSSGIDNGFPTTTARVTRRSLSEQTQVSATLGYANPSTIVLPTGTAPSNVQQAQQAADTAQAQLATARSTLAADAAALAQARSALAAARAKEAIDCAGANAAQSASSSPAGGAGGNGGGGGGSASTPCADDAQTLTTDEQAATQAEMKVAGDEAQSSSSAKAVASAQSALASAQSSASMYGQTSTYTSLPAVGQIVKRGQALYSIGGQQVVLLYGAVAPWRAFSPGMTPGRDIAELNANLRALGYGRSLRGNEFTSATEAAVKSFQSAHGLPATGELMLGSVVFEPQAVRVTSVTPTPGATAQPGPVLGITSTRRVVTIALDASQQTNVRVGDPVTITLPDNSTTPGRVSYVGTVATTPASSDQGGGGGGSSSPTIEVDVTPTDPAATGRLDQAPVDVSITTGSVKDVLVVPVNALLALSSGGYALEVLGADGSHRLAAVSTGLFDDAEGLVQVQGSSIAAGQRVVVPSS